MQIGNTLKVPVTGKVTGSEEKEAIIRVAEENHFSPGKYVEQFEHEFAKFIGKRYALFVNSGSSANLLAVAGFKKYSELVNRVFLPAVTFPTTINPYIQHNYEIELVDINLETLQADMAFQDFGVHTLGNYSEINILEDSCFTGNTLVPTKLKTKKIKDIIIGDKVLGFDGLSFKENTVVAVSKKMVHYSEIKRITLGEGIVLRCTNNHKFYCNGEWIRADQLKVGDELWQCGWAEYVSWRRNYKLSDEGRKIISDNMKKNNPSYNPENIKKGSSNRKSKKPTRIEQTVINIIEENNLPISYVGDYSFWIGNKEKGYKNPDFISMDKKIVFEVYDPTYNNYKGGKRDLTWENERRNFFEEFGYKTIFIKLSGHVNFDQRFSLTQDLRKYVSNGIKIKSIDGLRGIQKDLNLLNGEKLIDGMVMVYDITCNPYHNFITNGGILTHNCDAMFPNRYKGLAQTFSFYPAHFLTTAEGGMVTTDNAKFYTIMKSIRDWGRSCHCDSGIDNTCGKRFSQQFGDMPYGYDHKYIYSNIGYNLNGTEFSAAMGIEQLKKLPEFLNIRKRNFAKLYTRLSKYSEMFVLPKTVIPDTAWFSFPLTIKSDAKFNRLDIINYLDKNGIGSRPIMAGNIARQPAYKDTKFIINQELKNSNIVTENSFYIGCWHGLSEEQIEYTINVFDDFIEDIYG